MSNESTPDLDDVQQVEEPEPMLEVPVRITNSDPIQVHMLPALGAVSRSYTVAEDVVLQLVGANMRRKSLTVWATCATAGGHLYIGVDRNEVQSETCARMPAPVDSLVEGPPFILSMTHTAQVWVKNPGVNPVTVSFIAEDWAN